MSLAKQKQIVEAISALQPFLDKYKFRWCITEGLARFLYGTNTDLDQIKEIAIDVEADKDEASFVRFMADVKSRTIFPLSHVVSNVYDHYVMEVEFNGLTLSVCPTKNLNIIDRGSGEFRPLYPNGLPEPTKTPWVGLSLPIIPLAAFTQMEQAFAQDH